MKKTLYRTHLASLAIAAGLTAASSAALIHHWTFEGSTADSGSGNNPLVLQTNAALSNVCSPVGNGSLLLDAATAPTPDGGATSTNTLIWGTPTFASGDTRTVAFWMKATPGQETNATMFGAGTNNTGTRFDIKVAGNLFRVEIQGAGQTTTSRVDSDRWHHVAVVAPTAATTMATLQFYIDGTAVTNASVAATAVNTATAPIHIGDSVNTGLDRDFNGYLDDIRIYDTALTPTEIQNLFNAGRLARCFASDKNEIPNGNSANLRWEGSHVRSETATGTADNFALGSNKIGASTFNFALLTGGPTYYLRPNDGTFIGKLFKVIAFDGTAKTFTIENGDALAADGTAFNWGGSFDIYTYAINYQTLTITDNQGGPSIDAAALSAGGAGTLNVSPTTTTTYTLTATSGATVDTRQVIVAVKTSPNVNTFTATPALFFGIGSPTLAWTTDSAKRIEISNGASTIATYTTTANTQSVLNAGTFKAPSINATATYTITAWINEAGTGNSTVAQTTVTVQPAPNFTLHASRSFIGSGNPITLSWNATVIQTQAIAGTFETFPSNQGAPLVDNDVADFNAILNSGTSYFMEVTNGNIAGSITTVTSWSGSNLFVADNFNTDFTWSSYRIFNFSGTDKIVINNGTSDIATITDPVQIAAGSLVINPGPSSTTTFTGTASITGATASATDSKTVTVGGPVTSYQELVLADAPVGYYRFEENVGSTVVYDSSGNGNHSTGIIGDFTSGVAGPLGKCGGFNGNETIVTPVTLNPQDPDNDDGIGDVDPDNVEGWTLESLIRPDVSLKLNNAEVIWANRDGTGIGRTEMALNPDGMLGSFLGGSTTPNPFATTDTLQIAGDADWYHAAITCTAASGSYTLRFFIDGTLVVEQPLVSATNVPIIPEAANGAWVIGSHKVRQAGQFWQGLLDEAAIYDHVLSPAEIASHANAFLAQSTGPLALGGTSRVVAGSGGVLTYKTGGASPGGMIDNGIGPVGAGVTSSVSIHPLVDTTYVLTVDGKQLTFFVDVIDRYFISCFGTNNGSGFPFVNAGGLTDGINYQLFTSPDLKTWTPNGPAIPGTPSGTATFTETAVFDSVAKPKYFYQIRDVK